MKHHCLDLDGQMVRWDRAMRTEGENLGEVCAGTDLCAQSQGTSEFSKFEKHVGGRKPLSLLQTPEGLSEAWLDANPVITMLGGRQGSHAVLTAQSQWARVAIEPCRLLRICLAEAGLRVQPSTEGLITGGCEHRTGQSAVSVDSFTID